MSDPTDVQPLVDPDEILRRQVHPTALKDDGEPNKAAFLPSPSHEFLLSTLRGSVDPREAFQRSLKVGNDSAGTWGIRVGLAIDHHVPCLDDAHLPDAPEDHASIDFRGLSTKGQREQFARKLRDASAQDGALYRPGAS